MGNVRKIGIEIVNGEILVVYNNKIGGKEVFIFIVLIWLYIISFNFGLI